MTEIEQLKETIAKLTAEVERLERQVLVQGMALHERNTDLNKFQAENTRLKAPVSDEEAWAILGEPVSGRGDYSFMVAAKQFTNELIASRAAIKEGQNG